MQAGEVRPGDTTLEHALETVRDSPSEARMFAEDPEGYLKSKGVALDGLRIGMSHGELTDQELNVVSGGMAAEAPTICASVGAVLCLSVGD